MASVSKAISAFGTLLKVGDGQTPEEFTTIAELASISGPSLSADVLESTTHNTPTPWKRFVSGLLDAGEINCDLNFNPGEPTHSATGGVIRDMVNRLCKNYQIVFPDDGNTTWTCPLIVTGFEMTANPAELLTASATFKVAGPPTLV